MATPEVSTAYDYFLNFVLEKATPQEVLAFELPEAIKQRAIDLLDKQDEDNLTPDELAELEEMAQIDQLLMALKARALAAMRRDG